MPAKSPEAAPKTHQTELERCPPLERMQLRFAIRQETDGACYFTALKIGVLKVTSYSMSLGPL